MLSHLMEMLLLLLIALSKNVDASAGSVTGNNGKFSENVTMIRKHFILL